MAKDYAQRGGSSRHARPKGGGGGGGVPGWIWMVAGLVMGLAVAAFVYIGRPLERDSADVEAPQKTAKPTAKKESVKIPPKEKPRFTFYELLPNQEVVLPREQKSTAAKSEATSSDESGQYIIQVASYRSQADAEGQRAKLALIGIESRVEKVTIDNKDTFYRVRIGPVSSLATAHTTMARLEEGGYVGMIVKLR